MASLADTIEAYLKRLLDESPTGTVVVRRSELAEIFRVAPSQINYVISTRFTLCHGYVVESRRGMAGFLRIARVALPKTWGKLVERVAAEGTKFSYHEAQGLLDFLVQEGVLSREEGELVGALLAPEVLGGRAEERDLLRGRILRRLLEVLSLRAAERGKGDAL
ncbi:MAG: Transcriptional regulator CtsR [Brockia lithotrophica]|uniref:Transcriptional regulator CtsR n=1 Tax=Brockia lithotrophica TaxID=933949 RepID=A0A2T5G530_9BACL|nr:CtsR family transcriptional regulator [Brockia lithotrophica]PTQ51286.1 MAG: Transcriptional regulator CtsR [Brockia lithotrophica]